MLMHEPLFENMAWLQQQSTRERPDTFRQLSSSSRLRTLQRGGPYIFCGYFFHHLNLKVALSNQLLQLVHAELKK